MAFALANRAAASSAVAAQRGSVRAKAAHWFPGTERPAYLDGSLPGDFGFDPLGLGKDPKALKWYVQAELIHARTAMMAAAGILIPGLATKLGVVSIPAWYEAGDIYNASAGAIPFTTLVLTQFLLTHFVEVKRWRDFENPGGQGEKGTFFGFEDSLKGDALSYPGGVFDPLGLAKDPAALADFKVKEIKNGRLAMMAMLGFYGQYLATGKGPIDNWFDHLADPWHTTVCDNGVSVPYL